MRRALTESNAFASDDPRFGPLVVRECVPAGAGFTRVTRSHTAYVNRPQEALSLPWIEKMPGEKQVRFIDGQIFVIQKYFGCQLIRAHIFHDEGQRMLDVSNAVRAAKTEREMNFEHAR